MSLGGIRALVARLHSDEELRHRFSVDPEAVLSLFKLTSDEKAAVTRAGLQVQGNGTLALESWSDDPTVWWLP